MSERWGKWHCPYEGCDETPFDPDDIRVTCCGNDHTVLLGPVDDRGQRWAEKHVPSNIDFRVAIAMAKFESQQKRGEG